MGSFYFKKIPSIIRNYYSDYIWRFDTEKKVVYLTFDDGPTPEVTEWVLDQLEANDALATFFMIGRNVEKFPKLAHKVLDAGHTVGNHSYSHNNGWKTKNRSYVRDVLRGRQTIKEYTGLNTRLFRPPYGRISTRQAKMILQKEQIVMMDVLSGDFDQTLSGDQCFRNVVNNTRSGSIVVFHDSEKAKDRLEYSLPKTLTYLKELGYTFSSLPTKSDLEPDLPELSYYGK